MLKLFNKTDTIRDEDVLFMLEGRCTLFIFNFKWYPVQHLGSSSTHTKMED